MNHVQQPLAGGYAYLTGGVLNGAFGVGGTWTAYSTWVLPAFTLGGTVTSNGQSFSGTIANLGTVTTVDLNGGTIDGATIGGAVPAAGTFTTIGATTGNITTVNATTVDTTSIEVTNLKAKDGTAAGSIADATGVVTLGSSVLTTTDINAGTIDGTAIGGASASSGAFTTVSASGQVTSTVTTGTAPLVIASTTKVDNLHVARATLSDTVTTNANLTGDVTSVGNATTLATVNANVGSFGSSTSIPSFTVNGKGLITAASGNVVVAPAGTLTGNTLAAGVTASSLTSLGTIGSLVATTADINGGTIDGTVIGGSSAAAGTFTTLTASGNIIGSAATSRIGMGTTPLSRTGYYATQTFTESATDVYGIIQTNIVAGSNTQYDGFYSGLTVSSGTITSAYGYRAADSAGAGAVTTQYGFYCDALTKGSTNWGVYIAGSTPSYFGGNVGIGVTPSYKLDVKGGAGNGVPAQRWEVDGGSGIYVELERDSGGGGTATFGTQTNHNLSFKTNDTVRATIDTSGNVQLGTTPTLYNSSGAFYIRAKTDLHLGANDTNSLAVLPSAGDRLYFTSAFHVTSATATGTTPAIQSGTYTPANSTTSNVTSSSGGHAQWMRVGNVVTVSGYVAIRPSSAAATQISISLPIASNVGTTTGDCAGTATYKESNTVLAPGYLLGIGGASDYALINFLAPGDPGSEKDLVYTFTYEVQ